MKTVCCNFILISVLFINALAAQNPIKYTISFANAVHHEAEVTIQFSDITKQPLQLLMSRSSPGRYALHEFAKNVYNVRAFDPSGKELPVSRPNVYQWDVAGNSDQLTVTYTIFGDRADGTYLAIDNSHAHMNMPATFMWANGYQDRPIEIHFDPPDKKWQVATQLKATDDPYVFRADNLDYFMDSPTELCAFEWRQWSLPSNGKMYSFRLAVHHLGSAAEVAAYEKIVRAIVNEQISVFGELPDFDYDSYTFIGCFLPYVKPDAMEHRNSTFITAPLTLKEDHNKIIDSFSHEFFHCWNVERMRPLSLQPFDFTRTNMSGELWFAEGFTNYYSLLALARAGVLSVDAVAKHFTKLVNRVLNSPGISVHNAVQMSQYAPFVDAGYSNDPKNLDNTYISYYQLGEIIALGMDLMIRKSFPGLSLDDYMRALWQKFGKQEKPYSNSDLQQVLAEVSGDALFSETFFNTYIYGHTLPDYTTLFQDAGFILEKALKDKAWMDQDSIKFGNGVYRVSRFAKKTSPLYKAAIDKGDIIVSIDGDSLRSEHDLQELLKRHKPADVVEIKYTSRATTLTTQLTLQENPTLRVVPFEQRSGEITTEIKSLRRAWLAIDAEEKANPLERYCGECGRVFPFRFDFCPYEGSALQITLSEH